MTLDGVSHSQSLINLPSIERIAEALQVTWGGVEEDLGNDLVNFCIDLFHCRGVVEPKINQGSGTGAALPSVLPVTVFGVNVAPSASRHPCKVLTLIGLAM